MLALIVLCILMFVGCYAAGYLPLAFNYSPSNLRMVTIFGAGLLVGAALAIIIPEGVATIYGMQVDEHGDLKYTPLEKSHLPESSFDGHHLAGEKVPDGMIAMDSVRVEKAVTPGHIHGHALIGVALTLGFVTMFLVDQLVTRSCCKACAQPIYPLFCCFRCCQDEMVPSASNIGEGGTASASAERSALTTTFGLVVHSIADGIAIGAAFGLTLDLTLILFFAIMLHKTPAAFGFVSFLLHEGLPRRRVGIYLFVFALASPIGALLTYLTVFLNSLAASDQIASKTTVGPSSVGTGFALLLSGGTFLYVATAHILPHLISDSSHSRGGDTEAPREVGHTVRRHYEGSSGGGASAFKVLESLAFVIGSAVPVMISVIHAN